MNVTDYTHLLNHPETINSRRTEELDKIVTEFPYFQSARALRLKGLYNEDSFRYNYALKVTAAFTSDRSVLFDFITSDSFTSVEKALYDKKRDELHAISVSDSEHVETSETENIRATFDTEFPASETPPDYITGDDFVAVEPIPAQEATPQVDPATRSVLDSIKEAELYAKSLVVADAEEVLPEALAEPEVLPEPEQAQEAPLEHLDLGKPLEFSKSEKHSFQEWLQLSQVKAIVRDDEPIPQTDETPLESDAPDTNPERQKKNELIERFIQTNPKIPAVKPDAKPASFIFEPSQADNSYLMTETLARVYLEQKKFEKAIQAYEILILKYPEKSSFFADRILDIRILQQKQ